MIKKSKNFQEKERKLWHGNQRKNGEERNGNKIESRKEDRMNKEKGKRWK